MKLRKLFSVMTMMIVSIFAFSSCVLYVNEERAVERIRVIPPDKALDFTVVMENSIVTNMDGEQKEIVIDSAFVLNKMGADNKTKDLKKYIL